MLTRKQMVLLFVVFVAGWFVLTTSVIGTYAMVSFYRVNFKGEELALQFPDYRDDGSQRFVVKGRR